MNIASTYVYEQAVFPRIRESFSTKYLKLFKNIFSAKPLFSKTKFVFKMFSYGMGGTH